MRKLVLACLFAAAGFINTFYGQSSLGIDSVNFSAPATANYNATYLFAIKVFNYGPQPYNGQVDIVYAIDSSSTALPTYDTTSSRLVNMNIPVGTEQPDSNSISIDPRFKSGINTVVIWPRTNGNIITHDSLKITVLVTGYAGINNYTADKTLVFPNPAGNTLYIVPEDPIIPIERVRIFDITGKQVMEILEAGKLDISRLQAGIYTLEIVNSSKPAVRYKIVKE
ncbi:MAG: T9SS type A sorting domain-containing protein [Bacteroidia bacterium]